MHRPTVGIIALVLIGLALLLTFGPWTPVGSEGWLAACWRIGVVMCLLWLAHPQLERLPGWIAVPIIGSLLLAAWRPKLLLVGLVIFFAMAILRPRKRPGAARQQPRSR